MNKISMLLLAILLSGCVGTSRPAHFYQLKDLGTVSAPVSTRRFDIGVEEVSIPKYLDRPQIVTMDSGSSQVKMSEFNRWGEPLSNSFSRTLADDISLYLPKSIVKFKTLMSEDFTYTVTVEVNKMDAVLGKNIVLDAWWTIYKDNRVVTRERSRLQATLTGSYEKLVEEESKLIGELARQISLKISKL